MYWVSVDCVAIGQVKLLFIGQSPWKVDDVIAGSLTKLMVTTESSVAEVASPDSTDISMS